MTGAVSPGSNVNVPNALTTLRIVMVPFFGWTLLHDGGDSVTWRLVAFALFAAAMITDKIDGDLARKHDLVTNFGKIADPIADKAITGMALIALSVVGDVWWWVTIVVLLREWSVTLLRLSVLRQVVIAASNSGKLEDHAAGSGSQCAHAAAAPWLRPRRRLRPLRLPRRAGVLRRSGGARRRGGDDPVVGLRVLPRRLASASRVGLAHRQLTTVSSLKLHQMLLRG